MKQLVMLIGIVPLILCFVGLTTGKMYYFFKEQGEFIGSVKSVSRDANPIGFWIFFCVTLGFGSYALYFFKTNF